MESRRYPTDLSDDEWCCISPHLPEPIGWGRPRLHGLRAILDAIFYVLKSGCPWRLLPRDLECLEDHLRLVQEMAHRRDVGASEHRTGQAPAFAAWQVPEPQRRDRGLPIRQDDRSGRRAKRLRRWQEGPRPQEAPAGGYRRLGARS